MKVLIVIIWVIGLFTAFLLVIKFFFTIFSLLIRKPTFDSKPKENSFACIITAFQDIEITKPLVQSILQQSYTNYYVYLVADDCNLEDFGLIHDRLVIIKPETKLGSKVRSMHYSLKYFIEQPDSIIIFDPDNLIHPNFFFEINLMINNGFKVVQGARKAKNLDTKIACLDALGEIYGNYTTRFTPFIFGSSASIAGSGMAIEYQIFLNYFEYDLIKSNFDGIILGEDKALQCYLAINDILVAYNNNAIVFDEKISQGVQLEKQRARWINAYLQNLPSILKIIVVSLVKFDFKRFLTAFIIVYPPIFMLALISLFIFVIGLFVNIWLSYIILISFGLFSINFLLVLILSNVPKQIWLALLHIPMFMFHQLAGLFMIGKSRKDFLKTKNSKVISIKEVLQNKELMN